MEAFHVIQTHPQILVGIGDENSQYDAWGNFSRAITANATPSPHLRYAPSEQDLFDSVTMRYLDQPALGEVPPGTTRARAARSRRSRGVAAHRRCRHADFRCVRFGQHLLHAVSELSSVGRLQPDRVSVPSVPEPFRQVGHGVLLPESVLRHTAGARADALARRRRTVDERARARHVGEGIHAGHIQSAEGSARPAGGTVRFDRACELPGNEDPPFPSPAEELSLALACNKSPPVPGTGGDLSVS